jgi:PAS domain S-box-containing protein
MKKEPGQEIRVTHAAGAQAMALPPGDALALIEAHGIGTWCYDVETNRLFWSEGISRILGTAHVPEQQTLESFVALVHPADRAVFADVAISSVSGGNDDREFRVLRANGELRWVKSLGKLVYSPDGRPSRVVGTTFDITEVRHALDALDQREGLYRAVRELLDVVIWSTDGDGQVRDEVSWWRETGQRGRVDGWNRLDSVHPEDRERARMAWDEALRNRSTYFASYRALWNGEHVPLVSRAVPVAERNGGIKRWVGITVRQDASFGLTRDLTTSSSLPLTPGQVRAARGYLGWSAEQLADRAGVSFSTVRRIETPGERGVRQQSLAAIRSALEEAGIRFAVDRDGTTCVSLRSP